jgi:hypothetical protein
MGRESKSGGRIFSSGKALNPTVIGYGVGHFDCEFHEETLPRA